MNWIVLHAAAASPFDKGGGNEARMYVSSSTLLSECSGEFGSHTLGRGSSRGQQRPTRSLRGQCEQRADKSMVERYDIGDGW